MCKSELHEKAMNDTPKEVEVPNSWPGLAVWVLGRWGIGAIGFVFLYVVYQDLRMSNERFAVISEKNVLVLEQLASKIQATNEAIKEHTRDK